MRRRRGLAGAADDSSRSGSPGRCSRPPCSRRHRRPRSTRTAGRTRLRAASRLFSVSVVSVGHDQLNVKTRATASRRGPRRRSASPATSTRRRGSRCGSAYALAAVVTGEPVIRRHAQLRVAARLVSGSPAAARHRRPVEQQRLRDRSCDASSAGDSRVGHVGPVHATMLRVLDHAPWTPVAVIAATRQCTSCSAIVAVRAARVFFVLDGVLAPG